MRRNVLALLFSVGCAVPPASDPALTTADLAAALRAGDADTLARLTGRSREVVVAALATSGAELHALGETLARTPTDAAARVTLTSGETVTLAREGGSWRVDRGVMGRPALARPEDAVLAFHDALVRSRLLAVTALMARAPRAELEGELARWIDGTADPDALEVSVQGEAADVLTPTGEHLELVREGGEWRVVELR